MTAHSDREASHRRQHRIKDTLKPFFIVIDLEGFYSLNSEFSKKKKKVPALTVGQRDAL